MPDPRPRPEDPEIVASLVAAAEAFTAGDWQRYGDAYAEDVVVTAPGSPGPVRGRAARVAWAQAFKRAFPDGRVALLEGARPFGAGDRLCAEATFEGTHDGELRIGDDVAIPPTGAPVRFAYCMVVRVSDGAIAEVREYFDRLELVQALSPGPPPG